MQTAKLFPSGKSQAVRLPKEFRFEGTEVGVYRVGGIVCLCSKDKALENFLAMPPMSDDFFEIMEHRGENLVPDAPRKEL